MDSGWKLIVVRVHNLQTDTYFVCEGCWERDPVVADEETAVLAIEDIYQTQQDRCQRCERPPA